MQDTVILGRVSLQDFILGGGGFMGGTCALGVSNCKHLTRFWMFLRRTVDVLICNAFNLFSKTLPKISNLVLILGGGDSS